MNSTTASLPTRIIAAVADLTDLAGRPPTYPDGHECNYYCNNGEHCEGVYLEFIPLSGADWFLRQQVQRRTKRRVLRVESAPEMPPSGTWPKGSRFSEGDKGYRRDLGEVAYRYWFIYPASIEAAVRA